MLVGVFINFIYLNFVRVFVISYAVQNLRVTHPHTPSIKDVTLAR